jgi:hypothetical protein
MSLFSGLDCAVFVAPLASHKAGFLALWYSSMPENGHVVENIFVREETYG